jgi:hypothetical protein
MKLGIAILALVASSAAFAASEASRSSTSTQIDWMVEEFKKVGCDNPPCRRGCDNPPCRASCDNPPCAAAMVTPPFPDVPDSCARFTTDFEQQACADRACAGKNNDPKVCGPRAQQKLKLAAFKTFAEREKGKVTMDHNQIPRVINTFNKLWSRYKAQNRDAQHPMSVQDFMRFVDLERDRNKQLLRNLTVLNNPKKDLDDLSLLSLEKIDNDSALKDTSNDYQKTSSGEDRAKEKVVPFD